MAEWLLVPASSVMMPADIAHEGQGIIGGERNHQDLAGLELLGGFGGVAADTDFALGVVLANADTGQQGVANHVDLDHVGGAGNANGHTSRHNNQIAGMDHVGLLGGSHRHGNQFIGGIGIIHQQGSDATVDVHLATDALVQHAGNDLGIGAETAQQTGRFHRSWRRR